MLWAARLQLHPRCSAVCFSLYKADTGAPGVQPQSGTINPSNHHWHKMVRAVHNVNTMQIGWLQLQQMRSRCAAECYAEQHSKAAFNALPCFASESVKLMFGSSKIDVWKQQGEDLQRLWWGWCTSVCSCQQPFPRSPQASHM